MRIYLLRCDQNSILALGHIQNWVQHYWWCSSCSALWVHISRAREHCPPSIPWIHHHSTKSLACYDYWPWCDPNISMVQDPDEPSRTFETKVQWKSETCELRTSYTGVCGHCNERWCMNNGTTYYTDEIHDVLLNGIADIDIRRKALSVLWHSKCAV